jgi:hypothetical protein
MLITLKNVDDIDEGDKIALYVSIIICIDGIFDHLCDIAVTHAKE